MDTTSPSAQLPIRIFITGTNGSGKDEVASWLEEKYGFEVKSVRAFIKMKAEEHGVDLSTGRSGTGPFAESMCAKEGGDYFVKTLNENIPENMPATIGSLRRMAEIAYAKSLRDDGTHRTIIIAVDADPKIRYDRIIARKSLTDHVSSLEKFVEEEEIESVGDNPNRMNLKKCIEASDIVLMNEGTLEEFHQTIERELVAIL